MKIANSREPLVSVVMPVFNAGQYLVDAVSSILQQTFSDWEMICVNDGSSDQSGRLLDWFASRDSRIRVLHQENAGIVGALNAGWRAARAPLICRMDSDDVALPERMERQVDFMKVNPACVVVGGCILEMDSENDPLNVSRLPKSHDQILGNLMNRKTGHFHPTTLIRAEALRAVGGYRTKYEWIEDHDLWLRLARRGNLANLPDVLLCYRQHAGSVCWQKASRQRELMNELLAEAHQARGTQIPSALMLAAGAPRSAAGPGKWARAAAKGGYFKSAWKHLHCLNRSSSRLGYKARMNMEVGLRLIAGLGGSLGNLNRRVTVPTFPQWHQAVEQAGLVNKSKRAA